MHILTLCHLQLSRLICVLHLCIWTSKYVQKKQFSPMLITKVVLASCWLLFTDVSPTTLFTSFCRVAVGSMREFKINDATAATTPQNLHTYLTKTKVLHALQVHFLIPCISFKFSTNLRREMTISRALHRT